MAANDNAESYSSGIRSMAHLDMNFLDLYSKYSTESSTVLLLDQSDDVALIQVSLDSIDTAMATEIKSQVRNHKREIT